MPNLNQTEVINTLKGLLNLNHREGDARLEEAVKIACQDVLREFKNDIGEKLIQDLPIVHEAASETSPARMYIHLPDDAIGVKKLYVGNQKITIVNASKFLDLQKSNINVNDPVYGYIKQNIGGQWIVELYPTSQSYDGVFVDLLYKVSGEDISMLPQAYKKLLLIGAGKEFLLWDTKHDPAIESKFNSRYKEEKGKLTSDQINSSGESLRSKTLEEQRLEDSHNAYNLTNSTDIR